MIGIYLITNKVNGKKYVGQSVNIEKRWKDHIRDSKKSEYLIHKAIRKYGVENFEFSVLEECPVDKLDEREIYWISELDTYNNGYNMTCGGEGHILYLDPKERARKRKRLQEEVVKNIEILIKKREENYKENIERIIQIMIENGKRIIKKKEVECGGRGQED